MLRHRLPTSVFAALAAAFALVVAAGIAVSGARAQDRSDLVRRIEASAAGLQRFIALLDSKDQATRLAALAEMSRSGDPALAELAIERGLASADPAMRAVALRLAFRPVRAIVAQVAVPQSPTSDAREVLKLCGSVNYAIEDYKADGGGFVAKGQDNTGTGQVSGLSIHIANEYGCSLTGTLGNDGVFSGIVSAPYRKGSLPATFRLR
jgi:hypothetical protein